MERTWFFRILGGAMALVGLTRYAGATDEGYWWRILWGCIFLLGIDLWTRWRD